MRSCRVRHASEQAARATQLAANKERAAGNVGGNRPKSTSRSESESENETVEGTYGGRFAPASVLGVLSFLLSLSFSFAFHLGVV